MLFHRKHLLPDELGAMLYEMLRKHLESDGELSLERLLHSLDLEHDEARERYAGEVIVGLMFAATLAIERSTPQRVAQQIIAGMKTEFFQHLEEQGANILQKAEWEATVANTFLEYRTTLEGYSGFEPPWRLGRQFFWNLTRGEEYIAMSIKISALYLLAARDAAQDLLNQYGPTLSVHPHPHERS